MTVSNITADPAIKIATIPERIVKSRFAQILAGVATVTVLSLTAPIGWPLIVVISGIALAALAYNKKRLVYEVSLLYSVINNKFLKSWGWYNEILPGKLTLGALPLKNLGHYHKLQKFSILSCVESFEMTTIGLGSVPVTPDDWKKQCVNQLHISVEDFHPVSAENLAKAVQFIEENENVYVHCKAGRSRSAAIVIAYLCKTKNISIDEAEKRIKAIRPRVSVGSDKKAEIQRYLDTLTFPCE